MAPAIQLQPDFQYSREVDSVQQRRDTARNILLALEKRQEPSLPLLQTSSGSAVQSTTSTSSSSAVQFAITSQFSSSTPGSNSFTSSSSLTPSLGASQSPSSPNPTTPPHPSSNRSAPSSKQSEAIVFGIIGGILGLLFLGLIAFRLLRRHQRSRSQKHTVYESFWERWNWGTYSPVDGDVMFPNTDAHEKATRSDGGPYTWRQKIGFNVVSEVGRAEGKKKKSGTLYKVRSFKPGEGFDIDSDCAPSRS